MLTVSSCISKKANIPWRIIEEEAVLVDVDRGEVIHLNPVGAEIWNLIDGKKSVGEIVTHIYQQFEVAQETAKKDTLEFLAKLAKKDIIE
ncbi:MAG: PqqD family protein [bacterium]